MAREPSGHKEAAEAPMTAECGRTSTETSYELRLGRKRSQKVQVQVKNMDTFLRIDQCQRAEVVSKRNLTDLPGYPPKSRTNAIFTKVGRRNQVKK